MTMRSPNTVGAVSDSPLVPAAAMLFWIGTGVFIANDFLWIALQSGIWLYLADSIFRVFVILVVFGRLRVSATSLRSIFAFLFFIRPEPEHLQKRRKASTFVWWTIATALLGVAINQIVWPFLWYRLPPTDFFSFPQLDGPLKVFDLTVGVVLVAISEEVVFRSLAFWTISGLLRKMRPGVSKALFVILASSLIFGLIHWGNGVHAVIGATIWGVVSMIALLRTRSIWPALIAHWITDLVAFSGLIPDSYYRLFVP